MARPSISTGAAGHMEMNTKETETVVSKRAGQDRTGKVLVPTAVSPNPTTTVTNLLLFLDSSDIVITAWRIPSGSTSRCIYLMVNKRFMPKQPF